MDQKRFLFWQKLLTLGNLFAVVVGLVVAFLPNSFILEIHNSYTHEVYNGGKPLLGGMMEMKKLLFGIIGGTIVGFHVLMIFISENAFKKRERWAYTAMWLGLLSWFVIDSGLSIFYGGLYNVLLINIPALIMIGIPLVITRSAFR